MKKADVLSFAGNHLSSVTTGLGCGAVAATYLGLGPDIPGTFAVVAGGAIAAELLRRLPDNSISRLAANAAEIGLSGFGIGTLSNNLGLPYSGIKAMAVEGMTVVGVSRLFNLFD